MRYLFIGDFKSNTGPAIANKNLYEGLIKYNVLITKSENKVLRLIEIFIKILQADVICFCSYSKLTVIGIKLSNFLNKKTYYLMHGSKSIESKIQSYEFTGEINEEEVSLNSYEEFVFTNVTKIFCVSESFMNICKKVFPKYAYKFDYINNSVPLFDKIPVEAPRISSNKNDLIKILSIGGGMKQKNIIKICEAIDLLVRTTRYNIELIVVGKSQENIEDILKYDFVSYYGQMEHTDLLELMKNIDLYIQNSYLETFGLSILEAVISGCDLLISQYIGVLDIFVDLNTNDIIYNVNDENEIACKIIKLIQNSNNKRVKQGINWELLNSEHNARLLLKKMGS